MKERDIRVVFSMITGLLAEIAALFSGYSRGSQGLSLFLEEKTDRQSRDGRVVMNRPHQCHPEAQPKDL